MDSSFFRVTKLAAWGERYFSCWGVRAAQCSPLKNSTAGLGMSLSWVGERVEASHPMLSTSEVLHDPGGPYMVTSREEMWTEDRRDKEHSKGAR